MWLFTPFGFFSIIQDYEDECSLLVRARLRADLVQLKGKLKQYGFHEGNRAHPIRATPLSDYPFRMSVTRDSLAQVMYEFTHDIDYTNFKDTVHDRQGGARAALYGRVWSTMMGLERSRRDWSKMMGLEKPIIRKMPHK